LVLLIFVLLFYDLVYANKGRQYLAWDFRSANVPIWLRTPYSRVKVYDRLDYRCMAFAGHNYLMVQTCMHKKRDLRFRANYLRMMFSLSALINSAPRRVLVLGLGGAALPRLFEAHFPGVIVDSVEIDPGVLEIARYYFRYRNSAQMKVYIADARQFVREISDKRTYDLIFVDCFDAHYIPPHLLNMTFFREVSALLSERGIIATNLFIAHREYTATLNTWHKVLNNLWVIESRISGNAVAFGTRSKLWNTHEQMLALAKNLKQHGKWSFSPIKYLQTARLYKSSGQRVLREFTETSSTQDLSKRYWLPSHQRANCPTPCCGMMRKWQGWFKLGKSKTHYTMIGQMYEEDDRCYGRFDINWREGRVKHQHSELFAVSISRDRRVKLQGILAKGWKYSLNRFEFEGNAQFSRLRGSLVRGSADQNGVAYLQ
jgi:spermidine synthase